MNQYKHYGYFNDNADIRDIITNKGWNNADVVASYLEDGYGKFYSSNNAEDFDKWSDKDIDNKTVFITSDGKYIVKFSEGHLAALNEDDHYSVNAGYFIDIWKREEESIDLSNERLEELSKMRQMEDRAIKCAIKDEFKTAFKNPGEGLDLYANASTFVYGMLDATGCIGKMFLNSDGEIQVLLVQEYEDLVEDFESRYFSCNDWPMLLTIVRQGIREGWTLEE